MSAGMITIGAAALQEFVREIFAVAGCSDAEASRIGRYLVSANLCGHDSHGVARVPRYVARLREGLVHADRTVQVLTDTPVLAIVDGRFGFGQTVAPRAVEIGIAKCRAMGLAAVGLRNAGHIGRVGDWAEMAAEAGLVSMHFVTAAGSVLVAPFGGVERRFSTAPCCIGVPRAGADPLILDFATSSVAEGKVLVASLGGRQLSDDALVGPDGATSGDPHLLYGDYAPAGERDYGRGTGAIRAFGDHKGSGLALMCELLGGAFTGNGATGPDRPFANGMFSIYIDAARVDASEFFPAEVERYIEFLKSCKPLQAGGEVLLPGEPEARMRAERRAHGVLLSPDTWAAVVATARSVGLAENRIPTVSAIHLRPQPA